MRLLKVVCLAIGLSAAGRVDAQSCAGDCDGNCEMTVDEVDTLIAAALLGGVGGCRGGDINQDGGIQVDEILQAVNIALGGCECEGF